MLGQKGASSPISCIFPLISRLLNVCRAWLRFQGLHNNIYIILLHNEIFFKRVLHKLKKWFTIKIHFLGEVKVRVMDLSFAA